MYINETKYAITNLIQLFNYEKDKLSNLISERNALEKYSKQLFENNKKYLNPETVLELSGFDSTLKQKWENIGDCIYSIMVNEPSVLIFAGSILQIAKQGISTVHHDLVHSPNGRVIGSQPIKNIIWQSRNQAMHYEDHQFSNAVVNCFSILKNDFGNDYSEDKYRNENMSRRIIELLGWTDYDTYENDMVLLLR
jgi:hypothetical protein